MSKDITRVVVPIDWVKHESWKYAIAYAAQICENERIKNITLLVHTKSQLEHTSLAKFIGASAVRYLTSNKNITVNSSYNLSLATMRNDASLRRESIIIAFFADDKLLELTEGQSGVRGVVVVPDSEISIQNWKNRWSPIIHGEDQPNHAQDLLNDTTVENALETLSLISNLSNGIMQSRDKENANEILRILVNKGHALDSNAVKSWAIKRGWKPKAADELATLTARIMKLKNKPSLSKIYNVKERYEDWKNLET